MSQNDFTLANQGFPSMRADMNSAFQALASNNSGGTAPATTFAHQWWYDTSTNLLMIRNSSNTAFEEFSSGGGVVYTEHSSNYTAVAGEGILADTTSNTWTLTLPASPSGGDVVIVSDAGDWSVNNLTVARNGSTINGNAENLILDIGKISVTFVYSFNDWQVFTQMGANGGLVVTETGTQTLTNKTINASQLTGALPAIDGSALTGLPTTIAEAFVRYSGTTLSTVANNGFSSITRSAQGNTTYVFSTQQADEDYVVEIYIQEELGNDNRNNFSLYTNSKTVSGFTVRYTNVQATGTDTDHSVTVRRI